MSASRTKFYRDKQNGKLTGVCAGVADYTGVDVTIVRVATVLLTLATGWIALGYIAAAFFAPKKPIGLYAQPEEAKFWQGVRSNPRRSAGEVRSKFRDIDRRLADLDTYATSRYPQLAAEIESLR